MKTLQWMSAASRRTLTLTKPGVGRVTVTPAGRGWTVQTGNSTRRLDALALEDRLERMAFQGWREALS